MATKVSYGWIRKGTDKLISAAASRTRLNLLGYLNLETMSADVHSYETLNSAAACCFLEELRKAYPNAPMIHAILDQASYNKCQETLDRAKELGIKLHFLPPYSPNLNAIERLWKVMNEYVRDNHFFQSAKEFRDAILSFFEDTWPEIADSMIDRINDNFQTLKPASSF